MQSGAQEGEHHIEWRTPRAPKSRGVVIKAEERDIRSSSS